MRRAALLAALALGGCRVLVVECPEIVVRVATDSTVVSVDTVPFFADSTDVPAECWELWSDG